MTDIDIGDPHGRMSDRGCVVDAIVAEELIIILDGWLAMPDQRVGYFMTALLERSLASDGYNIGS